MTDPLVTGHDGYVRRRSRERLLVLRRVTYYLLFLTLLASTILGTVAAALETLP